MVFLRFARKLHKQTLHRRDAECAEKKLKQNLTAKAQSTQSRKNVKPD
jgi:hypothetical protein